MARRMLTCPWREQVDDLILNFSSLMDAIHFGTFEVKLSSTVFTINAKEKTTTKGGERGKFEENSRTNSKMRMGRERKDKGPKKMRILNWSGSSSSTQVRLGESISHTNASQIE